jgi:hypothetical protein
MSWSEGRVRLSSVLIDGGDRCIASLLDLSILAVASILMV